MNHIASQTGEADLTRVTKRQLVLRDSLFFVVLSLIAAALAGVTLFLFRSFESHREELAVRWAGRGQTAMQQGHPEQAVKALRVALSYEPDERSYQLLLAEALADSGSTEEATNYFMTLRDSQPGDGFINLELARLARKKNNPQEAIGFYRAAIFGDWRGDGAVRRREVRLELADYLTQRKEFAAARAELLIAAGNAGEDPNLNLLFGGKLEATGDAVDALAFYKKALAGDPHNEAALRKAGELAYSLGDYASARGLLLRALNEEKPGTNAAAAQEMSSTAHNAERMLELSLSRELPANDRAGHLAIASKIALARLNSCLAAQSQQKSPQSGNPSALQDLKTQWKAMGGAATRRELRENAAAQDNMAQLIFDTEIQTAQICGAPTGDDALLLTLSRSQARRPQQNGAPE